MKQDPTIPVYLITGFLDSGKSNFLKFTLQEDYFNDRSKTLLLLCEEGEEEYSADLLKKTHTTLIPINSEDELNTGYLTELDKKYKPDRVLIEYNGMWSVASLLQKNLPKYWVYYQIITILDGSCFGLYLQNIRTTAMEMLTNTDMVIFNRCGEDTDLVTYQRAVRSANTKCDLIFEDENGEELECPEPDLPYSIESEEIDISDENFPTFYIDLSEHPERYINKKISFLMQITRNATFPDNMFAAGRRAMTCCVNDIRMLAYIFVWDKAKSLKNREWANIRALLKWEFNDGYKEEGPVFYVDELKLANRPAEEVVTF